MASVRSILLFSFFILSLSSSAQKVKYKDIYVWLGNNQFSEAEPFLRKYLKDNDDNPNAYLYMGLIYEFNGLRNDVLKENRKSISNLDSALFFLDKAFKTITEKELKRNDEYYETFRRRDLRTGENNITLSNVQFFIEKKQQAIRERSDKVKLVNYYFTLSDSLYKKSQFVFLDLQGKFGTTRSLLLKGDETTISTLSALADRFDSCVKAFDIYQTNLQSLGKTNYAQQLELKEFELLERDGQGEVDFFENAIRLWNYKDFAEKKRKALQQDILPLREHLVAVDIELNNLRSKMEQDSVSVRKELVKLSTKFKYQKLQTYDPNPLPLILFNAKIAEINYKSDLIENAPLRDSADVRLKLKIAQQELATLNILDSLASELSPQVIETRKDDYASFIATTYNSDVVLKSFVNGLQDFTKRELQLKKYEVAFRQKGVNWLVSGNDSVALYLNPGISYTHQPLSIVDEKFASGLVFTDSLNVNGYFYTITPSRKPDVKVAFPVDKPSYKRSLLMKAHSFTIADPGNQIFFAILYSDNKVEIKDKTSVTEKYSVTIAKIYRSDGLAWSSNFLLDWQPVNATFVNGELIVTSIEGLNRVVDKNGKLKE